MEQMEAQVREMFEQFWGQELTEDERIYLRSVKVAMMAYIEAGEFDAWLERMVRKFAAELAMRFPGAPDPKAYGAAAKLLLFKILHDVREA